MMGISMNNSKSSQKNIKIEDIEPSNKGRKFEKGKQPSQVAEKGSKNYPVLSVIPIVGIPGVGKTALAKVIYNDQSVIQHFELRSWIYVPESKAIETIFREITESTGTEWPYGFGARLTECQDKFTKTINNKRVLIVLDNMWEEDLDCEYLCRVLIKEVAPGSIVIVTTQSHQVANEVATMTQRRLNVLEQNNFLPLFEHYAFGKQFILDEKTSSLQSIGKKIAEKLNGGLPLAISDEKTSLRLIGKKIAKKLNGLPLAAVAVGSFLRQNLNRESWKNILESDWWNIGSNLGEFLPSLAVSFQHLDIELRQCFAFCSLVPRGVFTLNDMCELWIAHDLIRPIMGQSNNLRGFMSERFNQLSERCLFQPVIYEATFYMPDSVRDLAVALSSNEMCIIKNDKIFVPQSVRHLTLFIDEFGDVEWGEFKMEKLRTLLMYCHLKSEDYAIIKITLSKSINLRVLDLSYVNLEKEPPQTISCLLHLRSLNLAYTGIEVFPRSFCRLFHLRVLNLKGCQLGELPIEFNQLTNLQFLHAMDTIISGIYGIGKLTKLQSLSTFSVRNKEGFRLTELKGMNEIDGCLRIENLDKVSYKEDAIGAKLIEKKFLRRLEFEWGSSMGPSYDDMKILDALKPHDNIEELVITNYRETTFLGWMVESHSLTNLQFICLRSCNLVVLPNLGQLPSLQVLKIEHLNSVTSIDNRLYGNGTDIFPSLKELSFSSLPEWEEWSNAQIGRFITRLKKLSISKCTNLKRIPFQSLSPRVRELEISDSGPFADEMSRYFERLTALTTLIIGKCEQRISVPCYNLRLLKYLYLQSCDNLHFAGGLKSLVKLKKLSMRNCQVFDESLHLEGPNTEFGLTSLTYLKIAFLQHYDIDMLGALPLLRVLKLYGYIQYECGHWFSELNSLEVFEICMTCHLPSSIESLPSLKKLTITKLRFIDSLPCNLPHSLKELHITECSKKLMDRCRPLGEDWPKIAHVIYIRVDGETIQMLPDDVGTSSSLIIT